MAGVSEETWNRPPVIGQQPWTGELNRVPVRHEVFRLTIALRGGLSQVYSYMQNMGVR